MRGSITRVGIGYDVHAFAAADDSRPLLIGGVLIPHDRGLAGHSDADVLLHAIVDALLGAAALGDIGAHFPSSEPRWKDAPSAAFLRYTLTLLRDSGWGVVNVDATVVAEAPRLTPHVLAIRTRLAEVMGLPLDAISVKAKTTDGLGFAGRAEGMGCYAVALIAREEIGE